MEFRFIDDDAVSQSRKAAKILEVFFLLEKNETGHSLWLFFFSLTKFEDELINSVLLKVALVFF